MSAVLIIGTSRSSCSNCKGSSVDPYAKRHEQTMGYSPGPGCFEEYTAVGSEYANFSGLYDRIKEMRPDLPFIGAAI